MKWNSPITVSVALIVSFFRRKILFVSKGNVRDEHGSAFD